MDEPTKLDESKAISPRPPSLARRVVRVVLRIGLVLGTAFFLVLILLMIFEERLIFFPARYPEGNWRPAVLAAEDVEFETEDGVRLHGWFCHVSEPRAVVLYSHGNAGNLTHRAEIIKLWQDHLDVAVFIYDYRGYGRSEGSPNENGLYADAWAAYRWLREQKKIPPDQIVLHGESIGCAVALELALKVQHRAFIMESPFTSAVEMGSLSFPFLPVRWLMRNRFDSLAKIERYHGPLLIIHGTHDSIVPFEMGRRLFEQANEPKRFHAVSGADHNDVPFVGGAEYFRTIGQFLTDL